MKAVIIYWSKTGNTEKVSRAIMEGMKSAGAECFLKDINDEDDIDFFDYDIICMGSPAYFWRPPDAVSSFIDGKFQGYRKEGRIKMSAPVIPGKYALVFCTYSGPHTGENEAVPVVKILGQYFEHLGYKILGEWRVPCEFHGREDMSTEGRLGDIRGKPTEQELAQIKESAAKLYNEINGGGK